jgi:hypothetical protein
LENRSHRADFHKILPYLVRNSYCKGIYLNIKNRTFIVNETKRSLKKITYSIGFLGAVTFTAGETFRLLHFAGASKLYIAGFLMVLLVFIPLLILDKYKDGFVGQGYERMKIILGGCASIIAGFSGLFKLMHLQGADILLLIGAFVFAVGFLPLYFYSMYKKSLN